MASIEFHGRVKDTTAQEALGQLAQFDRYSEFGDSIRSVEAEFKDDALFVRWDVDFRGGSIHWTERDTVDLETLRVAFELVEGNLRRLEGSWQLEQDGPDTLIHYAAEFAIGLPELERFFGPIAEATFRENLVAVMGGLFGEAFSVEPAAAPA